MILGGEDYTRRKDGEEKVGGNYSFGCVSFN